MASKKKKMGGNMQYVQYSVQRVAGNYRLVVTRPHTNDVDMT